MAFPAAQLEDRPAGSLGHLGRSLDRRREDPVIAVEETHTCPPAGFDHRLGVLDRAGEHRRAIDAGDLRGARRLVEPLPAVRRERLRAQDVLAARGASLAQFTVGAVRDAEVRERDRRIGEQCVDRGGAVEGVRLREGRGLRRVARRRDEFDGDAVHATPASRAGLGEESGPDDRHTQPLAHDAGSEAGRSSSRKPGPFSRRYQPRKTTSTSVATAMPASQSVPIAPRGRSSPRYARLACSRMKPT